MVLGGLGRSAVRLLQPRLAISCSSTSGQLFLPCQQQILREIASRIAGDPFGDKVRLQGLEFFGYHGVFPEERKLGQRFLVDATLWVDLSQAGATDDLKHTVNYAEVYSQIKTHMEGPPFLLLEAAAEHLAQKLLTHESLVTAVQLYIRKPHVAVPGPLEALGIEIYRQRKL